MTPVRGARIALVGVSVLLLHAALIATLSASRHRSRTPAHATTAPQRITLRLIDRPVPAPALALTKPPLPDAAPGPSRRHRAERAQPPTAVPTPDAPAALATATAPVAAPAASASASNAWSSLLDTEATRRAIRTSARTRSLGDQLAESREEPARAGPGERLQGGIRDAARGDCMKGEFAGAGMGLLSLPFLAAAAVGGQCTR